MKPPAKPHHGAPRSADISGGLPPVTRIPAPVTRVATRKRLSAANGMFPPNERLSAAFAAAWIGISAPETRVNRHNASVAFIESGVGFESLVQWRPSRPGQR